MNKQWCSGDWGIIAVIACEPFNATEPEEWFIYVPKAFVSLNKISDSPSYNLHGQHYTCIIVIFLSGYGVDGGCEIVRYPWIDLIIRFIELPEMSLFNTPRIGLFIFNNLLI